MLRAGIAHRYPNIGNATASRFIDEVLHLRHLDDQAFRAKATAEGGSAAPVQTPVVGVPDVVRKNYSAYLQAKNDGADDTPLIRQWLPG
ncbi:hypothetical protein [Pseudomonas sp. 22 E 5]|nr:hypothetical protein [Pseudomonas sp. 22 E 5]